MSISPYVPNVTHYAFKRPELNTQSEDLTVGSSVKDLPDGAQTSMKTAQEKAVKVADERFEKANEQFDKDLSSAKMKAVTASTQMDDTKKKKLIAFTLLVISIVLFVGAIIAAATTGILPLLLVAVAAGAGVGVSGYYFHKLTKKIPELQEVIDRPENMKRPVKEEVAPYNPSQDLELKSTRTKVMETLAKETLEQLANEKRWSKEEIVEYALLDGSSELTDENRPQFYANVLELIKAYHRYIVEREGHSQHVQQLREQLIEQLRTWKNGEMSEADKSQYDIDLLDKTLAELEMLQGKCTREEPVEETKGKRKHAEEPADPVVSETEKRKSHVAKRRVEIVERKMLIAKEEGSFNEKIKNWFDNSMEALARAHAEARHVLEVDYNVSKHTAAAAAAA